MGRDDQDGILLLRGSAVAAAADLADCHAPLLLDQQMRDAEAALARARRALAVAGAEDAQEEHRLAASAGRVAELEPRALAALEAGREDLAAEVAGTINGLEADAEAAREARAVFRDEITRLRAVVARDTQRLAALGRGRRLARAAEAVRVARRGRVEPAAPDASDALDRRLAEAGQRAGPAQAVRSGGGTVMNQHGDRVHAPAWVFFTYASFAGSLGMLVLGISLLPLDLWMRAFLFMGVLMLVQACVTLTKTQRDLHEGARLVNRIEDARTEKLLMEAGRP